MDDKHSHLNEEVLQLTLEIIYLLTGEKCAVVKMASIECFLQAMYPPVAREWCRNQSPVLQPSHDSLPPEKPSEKKILEVTKKIIELLTGEVPVRSQDVTVYFSMEEWKYLEKHKEVYKDPMMENRLPLMLQDGPEKGSPPERSTGPLYSQECVQKDDNINHQDRNQVNIKAEIQEEAEETHVRDNILHEEDVSPATSTDGSSNRIPPEGCSLHSQDCTQEDTIIPLSYQEECRRDVNINNTPVYDHADGDDSEDKTHINAEQQYKEEVIAITFSPTNQGEECNVWNISKERRLTQDTIIEDDNFSSDSRIQNTVTSGTLPELQNQDTAPDLHHFEETPDKFTTPSSNIHPGLRSLENTVNYSLSKIPAEHSALKVHVGIPNIPPRCLGLQSSRDPSISGESSCSKKKVVTPNVQPRLLSQKRSTGTSIPCPSKLHMVTQNIHPVLLSLEMSPGSSISEEVSSSKVHMVAPRIYPGALNSEISTDSYIYKQSTPNINANLLSGERVKNIMESSSGANKKDCAVFLRAAYGDCFTQNASVQRQQNNPSADRPHVCFICGKSFRQKDSLTRHMRIHTGEKPYPCFECGKRFTQKSDLVVHQRIHTNEKPYSCFECGRQFRHRTTLLAHQKLHTCERAFACSYCEKSYIRKPDLLRHLQRHESDNVRSNWNIF
ncbi:oocyte zinc finger protein XlCOF7.1-like [Hyperolius riggenbachi]|uniref:oocyte zinc finger protein XlCOF7.1-like n=1 Tax=Hyperolius riggenbachi TaxID=752182 RepID=UPI0035A2A912